MRITGHTLHSHLSTDCGCQQGESYDQHCSCYDLLIKELNLRKSREQCLVHGTHQLTACSYTIIHSAHWLLHLLIYHFKGISLTNSKNHGVLVR